MTVENALGRFVVCTLLLALASRIFPGIVYGSIAQVLVVGVVLAVASIALDMLLLDRLGHIGSFITDTIAATVVVWAPQFFLPGAAISWGGALGAGVLSGLSEIGMHYWVQSSRRRGITAPEAAGH